MFYTNISNWSGYICRKFTKIICVHAGPGGVASGLTKEGYTYTDDLLQLSHQTRPNLAPLPSQFGSIVTPLRAAVWVEALSSHPNQVFARYLVEGMRYGFHVGYDGMDPDWDGGLLSITCSQQSRTPRWSGTICDVKGMRAGSWAQ